MRVVPPFAINKELVLMLALRKINNGHKIAVAKRTKQVTKETVRRDDVIFISP
jgi:hypothetical protein